MGVGQPQRRGTGQANQFVKQTGLLKSPQSDVAYFQQPHFGALGQTNQFVQQAGLFRNPQLGVGYFQQPHFGVSSIGTQPTDWVYRFI